MGVLVSPAARSTVPRMMLAVRNSMGRYRMKKYREAAGRMWGSARIQTGIRPLRETVRTVHAPPMTSTDSTA